METAGSGCDRACSLEATAGPFDSPVHLVLGEVLLLGFALDAGLVQKVRRRGLLA